MRFATLRVGHLSTRVLLWAAIFSIAVLGFASNSGAAILPVGGTLFPVPAEAEPAGGVVVAGGVPLPFVGFGFTGTLTSTVIRGDTTNPNGLNALTFTYLLTNDAGSAHVIHRMTVGRYENAGIPVATDVSYNTASVGVIPTLADRTTADVIGFSFASTPIGSGHVPPGGASRLLVVQTDALNFLPTFASVIDGTTATVASWAPFTQIPEPSTCVLAGMGLVAMVGVARRFRR